MNELEDILRGTTTPDPDAEAAARRLSRRAAEEGAADIAYCSVDSPLGPLLGATTSRGLITLSYVMGGDPDALLADIARRVSPRIVEAPARLDPVRRELEEYFEGARRDFEIPIDWTLVGPFARRVLRATARIPFGEVSSYAEVAGQAGSPRGHRAAGNALGSNPMPIVVPCHRVLRTGGALGGYGGGIDRKRFLLALEGSLPDEPGRGAR
jgi:methylated-DNA-[protein]-cysteine S-methyltransferase